MPSTTGTPDTAREPDREGPWRELLAGARFLWDQPVLRALTVLLTFFIFATEGLPDVLIFYLKHDLSQGDGIVGVVLGVAALGTVAGALAVAPLRRRLGFGACWTGAVLVCGLAVGGLGMSGSVPGVAGLAAIYLGCTSVAGICSMSLRQQITPDHLLGPGDGRLLDHPLLPRARRRGPPDLDRRPLRRRVSLPVQRRSLPSPRRSGVAHPSQAASPRTGPGCQSEPLEAGRCGRPAWRCGAWPGRPAIRDAAASGSKRQQAEVSPPPGRSPPGPGPGSATPAARCPALRGSAGAARPAGRPRRCRRR